MLVNLWVSWRKPIVAGDNPWDAHTLEWFTTSPPPHHNYTHLPPIRSERPTWDYNHPDAPSIGHGGRVHEHHLLNGHDDRVGATSAPTNGHESVEPK
jgi:heme/copper-type cytochrome/quinol oxidase subunit 1